MKVLHLSTWKEICGIASYTENLIKALASHGLESDVYPVNRKENKYLMAREVLENFNDLYEKAMRFDVIHIQHEFGFFGDTLKDSLEVFEQILRNLRKTRKPIVVTFHSEPTFVISLSNIVGSGRAAARHIGRYRRTRQWRRIAGLFGKQVQGIVHTKTTRLSIIKSGVPANSIHVIPLGVPKNTDSSRHVDNHTAKERLGYPDGTVLLSLFGFVATYKGPVIATKALTNLPANYHLAIVGGSHPEAKGDQTINAILRTSEKTRALRDRVRVTGYVDGEKLALYQDATDLCLAPYRDVSLSSSAALTWALASGKPVIASSISAFKELSEAHDCLSLISEDSEYELAWRIKGLMSDPTERNRLIQNAHRYINDNDLNKVAALIISIYKGFANSSADDPAVMRPHTY